ncbi:IS3 family transposase [Thermosulfurimonas sp. F29]|uniref:IS3 family transposase n=1 Tax=Thermosulfurimonas sp. F29 TaxID=2867247 RepID=UPI001C83DAE9|nr:IS3 family transposase [Thermosulfurimonas sp. F29]MBX6424299.1 IS3 family transposase [Thermosulfurimonas sp. F29]
MLVAELVENGLSLNKALRLVDLSKSSYFYRSKKASYEEKLVRRIKKLALENPAYGYRRLWFLIQKEGFEVSLKKFYRLYRKLGLSLCLRKKRGWRRTPRTEEAFPIEVAREPSKRWSEVDPIFWTGQPPN